MQDIKNNYLLKLKNAQPVSYHFVTYSHNVNELTHALIHDVLAEKDVLFLFSILSAFLSEIINNAVKANLKRAYFEKKMVDITDPDDYKKLMEKFRLEAVEKLNEYIPYLKEVGLRVKVSMKKTDKWFGISVVNNTGMTAEELERVKFRVQKAKEISGIEEIFAEISDTTEGAGLGLIMNIMLLKTSGIGVENFSLESNGKITEAALKIPYSVNKPVEIKNIHNEVIKNIQSIPVFPETINRVIQLCEKPKSTVEEVSSVIEKDVALSADILKLANSGGFITSSRVNSIFKAVTIVGFKTLKQMAMASASQKIMNENFKIYSGFWEEAYQCALYSKLLADEMKMNKESDTLFLGGLLRDLGKIILHVITPKILKKINEDSSSTFTTSTLEEVTLGISHNQVGAEIAEKWNFSKELIEMIRYHHFPVGASDEHKKHVSIVHMSDLFIDIEKRKKNYKNTDIEAAKQFDFKNYADIKKVHEIIMEKYKKIQEQID